MNNKNVRKKGKNCIQLLKPIKLKFIGGCKNLNSITYIIQTMFFYTEMQAYEEQLKFVYYFLKNLQNG